MPRSQFRQHILELGMMPVIPPRSNRKEPADYDRHLYRERHLVECFINSISWAMKHYRRIFSRFEKLDTRYLGFLHFTAEPGPHPTDSCTTGAAPRRELRRPPAPPTATRSCALRN